MYLKKHFCFWLDVLRSRRFLLLKNIFSKTTDICGYPGGYSWRSNICFVGAIDLLVSQNRAGMQLRPSEWQQWHPNRSAASCRQDNFRAPAPRHVIVVPKTFFICFSATFALYLKIRIPYSFVHKKAFVFTLLNLLFWHWRLVKFCMYISKIF